MKYIKTYESKNKPKIGDYVICRDYAMDSVCNELLSKCVGKIINVNKHKHSSDILYKFENCNCRYFVEFKDLPHKIDYHFSHNVRAFERREILDFATTKEDLEIKINAQKYNL